MKELTVEDNKNIELLKKYITDDFIKENMINWYVCIRKMGKTEENAIEEVLVSTSDILMGKTTINHELCKQKTPNGNCNLGGYKDKNCNAGLGKECFYDIKLNQGK